MESEAEGGSRGRHPPTHPPRMMGGLGQGRGQREKEEEANFFVDSKFYQSLSGHTRREYLSHLPHSSET